MRRHRAETTVVDTLCKAVYVLLHKGQFLDFMLEFMDFDFAALNEAVKIVTNII